MRSWAISTLKTYLGGLYFPSIGFSDIIEILLLSIAIYQIILWIKNTKAWMLLRGIIMMGLFLLVAWLLRLNTILFLAKSTARVIAVAAVVIFQPELRRFLERLGEKNILTNIQVFDKNKDNLRFSDEVMESLIRATFGMARVKTGALMVIEQSIRLDDYEKTGIELDCKITEQVILNIFEHNTPLHDGAVIIKNGRIASATCYLPLSDNMQISKDLGTRHRAALGMSEVTDAAVIVVSEETGHVSLALGGTLYRNLTNDELRVHLQQIQNRPGEHKKASVQKGGHKNEDA